MQLHELACSYMSLHAVTEAYMQLHKVACSYMSLLAVTWTCMHLHELACSFMSLHTVSWACMQFHELACSSFVWAAHKNFAVLVFACNTIMERPLNKTGLTGIVVSRHQSLLLPAITPLLLSLSGPFDLVLLPLADLSQINQTGHWRQRGWLRCVTDLGIYPFLKIIK